MKVKKRVVVAIFHIVVISVYLTMWMVRWGIEVANNREVVTVATDHWQSPAAYAIDKIQLLAYEDQECYISIYDNIFHEVCNDLDTDWRLMSAIAYAESRFKPHVISHSGAIGLMQIMPRTATIYGATKESVADPTVNIRVASMHYNLIDYMLDMPDNTPLHDRMSINLACYNGGIGRVYDAQRLARHMGESPYSWSVISKQLVNLLDPEFYELEFIKSGRFSTARHTVAYVNSVMYRYDLYCVRTEHCTHHLEPITGHRY